jgi:hypothetical protein
VSRTVIRYPGRPGRFVGPFGDENVAREWFAKHGGDSRVTFLPLELPDPPPATLPAIPKRFRLRPGGPAFARVDELADQHGEWFVLAEDRRVPLDRSVRIYRFTEQDHITVHIDYYIAERIVHHRSPEGEDLGATRYVLAAFTNETSHEWSES